MREKLTIVKVGGAIVEDEERLKQLLKDFTLIDGAKMLVHGGGRRATKIASALGIESHMVNGRRITDEDMLEVVTMVYGGLVNKHIVARLQSIGVNALGLTGVDMNCILSRKRPPVSMRLTDEQGEPHDTMIDFGYVGDPVEVNGEMLATLINGGVTPIMAPLTHDGNGNMLNTNADTIASEVAKAMATQYDTTLIYCFEKTGVLTNPDDDNSVISTITRSDFDLLVADGTISGGMIPKIENALRAIDAGVKQVNITLATAIDGMHGTLIK